MLLSFALTLLYLRPASALTAEEFGAEAANMLLNRPRVTTRTFPELVRDAHDAGGLNENFLKGFYGPRPAAEADQLTIRMVEDMDADCFVSRLLIKLVFTKRPNLPTSHRMAVDLVRRLPQEPKACKTAGLLPMLDAYILGNERIRETHRISAIAVRDAHERLLTYLAKIAKGDAVTLAQARETRDRLAKCNDLLMSDVVFQDYF